MAAVPEFLDQPSFDPLPPGAAPDPPPPRQWWGRHPAEMRWQAEFLRLLVDPVFRGEDVPRGHGEPVVLIPGFLAGDASLSVMRNWLERLGYAPHGSGITANVDCSDRAVDRLDARVARLHARTGKRVALVGHSRGGHFAKALARRRPEWVSCVISLGAGLDLPFDISIPTRATVAAFRELHRLTSDRIARNGCFTESCKCRFASDYAADFPAEVPLTSVYSKGDGVVWWEACVVPYATNVEVTGSHIGLAFNRKAYRAVGDALAAADAGLLPATPAATA
jgi:pimeloyl-ACP methyl ester carboxylesterase